MYVDSENYHRFHQSRSAVSKPEYLNRSSLADRSYRYILCLPVFCVLGFPKNKSHRTDIIIHIHNLMRVCEGVYLHSSFIFRLFV